MKPLPSVVDALYGSVPPLKPPIDWKEMEAIIHEEIARNAASEGIYDDNESSD